MRGLLTVLFTLAIIAIGMVMLGTAPFLAITFPTIPGWVALSGGFVVTLIIFGALEQVFGSD